MKKIISNKNKADGADGICNVICSAAEIIILFLSGLFSVWLFLTAGFSTTAITQNDELAYYLRDNIFLNLLLLLVFAGVILTAWKKWAPFGRAVDRLRHDEAYALKIRRFFLCITFAIGIIFVLLAQRTPFADARYCSMIAGELPDHNYESFATGGYLNTYPNQMGIIWIFALIEKIAGTENFTAIQVINAAALTLFYWTLSKITDLFAEDRLLGTAVTFAGMLFVPAYYYTTFVYGTLLGLSFAAGGFYCCLLFQREKRPWQAVLMSAFLSLSIVCKSNYLIFVIGVLVYELIILLSERKKRTIIAILLTAFVLSGTSRGVASVTTALTGQTLAAGESKWAWVAMGLQGDSDGQNPGWYNGYNEKSFVASEYDTKSQEAEAKASVKKSLAEFKAHPGDALKFFSRKNASQWNCPDFQGEDINQVMGVGGILADPMSRLLSMKGAYAVLDITNPLYELMVTGLLLELILGRGKRKRHPEFLAFKVILVGGFLFHTVWEAKAQYTLPYMMLMIPVSVCGWEMLYMRLSSADAAFPAALVRRVHLSAWGKSWLIGLAAVILLVQSGLFEPLNALFLRDTDDTADFNTYVQIVTPLHLPEGDYEVLAPTSQGEMEIASDNNPVDGTEQLYIRLTSQDAAAEDNHVTLVHSSAWDRQYLRLHADDLLLEVPEGHTDDGQVVQSGEQRHSSCQQWQIYQCTDGTCRIMLAGSQQALTFNEDGQYLSLTRWEDAPQQHWVLRPEK